MAPALLQIGGTKADGQIDVMPAAAKNINTPSISLSAKGALVAAGGPAIGGEIAVSPPDAKDFSNTQNATVDMRGDTATIRVGGSGVDGQIVVTDHTAKPVITLDGKSGDIVLSNADCAEDFDVTGADLPGARHGRGSWQRWPDPRKLARL